MPDIKITIQPWREHQGEWYTFLIAEVPGCELKLFRKAASHQANDTETEELAKRQLKDEVIAIYGAFQAWSGNFVTKWST